MERDRKGTWGRLGGGEPASCAADVSPHHRLFQEATSGPADLTVLLVGLSVEGETGVAVPVKTTSETIAAADMSVSQVAEARSTVAGPDGRPSRPPDGCLSRESAVGQAP